MQIGSYTKLIVAILIIASVTFLAYFGKIAEQAVTALIGAVVGYVLGNGSSIIQSKVNGMNLLKKDV